MRSLMSGTGRWFTVLMCAALGVVGLAAAMPNLLQFRDPTGTVATYSTLGATRTNGPFFQSLGTNGRSCATCHTPDNAYGLSSSTAQAVFASTRGRDPLFADIDGANCPGAARDDASAHSLLLDRGLIRVALPLPATAEYTVETVYDPYGCADTIDPATGRRMLSVYRRPLPAANLPFLSAVMWDGRESVAPLNDPDTFSANLVTDLGHQALDATLGHAQASHAPTNRQLTSIVDFELSLFSAQATDTAARSLRSERATGGPVALALQPYYPGINDSLGSNPGGEPFNDQVFTLFEPWRDLPGARRPSVAARKQIAAGEALFNSAPLQITGVGGLNDALGQTTIPATCSTCHDTPNVGDHSLPVPLDIGVSHSPVFEKDATAAAVAELSGPDLPVFKITCTAGTPGRTVFTTDPGRALISGRCVDLNRVKGPVLRGLAARAPYFHNGAAATLDDVVNFYDERFQMQLSDEQKQQLVAFLRSL